MSGIYQIRNCLNNKIYIGSSKNIHTRFIAHKNYLLNNNHVNIHLQRAWNKYGEENFVFELLILCEDYQLKVYEQWCLDNVIKWGTDYNINKVASGGDYWSGKKRPEFAKKISGKNNPSYGKNFSKEHRNKISDAMKIAGKGRLVSKDTRGKIGLANSGERCATSKLTEEDVISIRELYFSGDYTQTKLGKLYGINQPQVSLIVRYKSWRRL